MIRVPNVRVVDEDGSQLGVMPTYEALRLAQERGYDLVEVAPMAVPPVARLLDYGQYKYEAAKKEKEARRHQRSVDFKEVRLKPKIGQGDFDTKVRRAIQFLEEGDRVKVACQFRGRELTHAHLGRDLLIKFADLVKDHGTVERQPLLEGKSMSIVIASTHKPKPQAPPPAEARAGSRPPTPVGPGTGPTQAAPAAEGTAEAPQGAQPQAAVQAQPAAQPEAASTTESNQAPAAPRPARPVAAGGGNPTGGTARPAGPAGE